MKMIVSQELVFVVFAFSLSMFILPCLNTIFLDNNALKRSGGVFYGNSNSLFASLWIRHYGNRSVLGQHFIDDKSLRKVFK